MLVTGEFITISVDQNTGSPVVVLGEIGVDRTISIAIDATDANTIALLTLGIKANRPLPTDLSLMIIENYGGKIQKVIINEYEKGIFSAKLHIINSDNSSFKTIDCRAGDGVILAMKSSAPILIDEKLFGTEKSLSLTKTEQIKQTITNMSTLEFGNYHL